MAFFDLSLKELQTYCPGRDERADFDSFWKSTLEETRAFPLNATFEKVDDGLVAQETFDVTFNGFGGQSVKGWLILPGGANAHSPLPCVVPLAPPPLVPQRLDASDLYAPTPEHLAALRAHGAGPMHRRRFAPVRAVVEGAGGR